MMNRVSRSLAFALAVTSGSSLASAQTQPAAMSDVPAGPQAPREPPGIPDSLRPQPGGITADGAAARAVQTSYAVRAARANTEGAGAARTEAALSMIPQLTLQARYTRLSPVTNTSIGASNPTPLLLGGAGPMGIQTPCVVTAAQGVMVNGATVPLGGVIGGSVGQGGASVCRDGSVPIQSPPSSFSFPVILDQIVFHGTVNVPITDLIFRLSRAYQAAGRLEQARRLDEETARSQAATDARVAFWEYVRAQGQLLAAQEGLVSAQRHRDDLAHLVEVGTAARVDLLRVEAQVAETERLVLLAREGVGLSEAQLRQRMHLGPGDRITLGESPEAPVEVPRNLQDLLQRADHDRPEVASLQAQREALDANVSATRASIWPSLLGQFNFDVANPNQRYFPQSPVFNTTWDASLILQWSPTSALVNNATTDRVAAQRDAIEANVMALREGLELEVRAAYMNAQTAAASIESTRRQLSAATESYRVRRERFVAGSATSADLTDAELDLVRARLAAVNAQVDVRESLARLRRAIGVREPR